MRPIARSLWCVCLGLWALTGPALAQASNDPFSALLDSQFQPRFVSVEARRVPLYTGPRSDSFIKARYQRAGLPLIQVEEFEAWAKVIDMEGEEGWVEKRLVTDRIRGFMVTPSEGATALVFADADPGSQAVAEVERSVVGKLEACSASWCRVMIALDGTTVEGFMAEADLWGADSDLPRF